MVRLVIETDSRIPARNVEVLLTAPPVTLLLVSVSVPALCPRFRNQDCHRKSVSGDRLTMHYTGDPDTPTVTFSMCIPYMIPYTSYQVYDAPSARQHLTAP